MQPRASADAVSSTSGGCASSTSGTCDRRRRWAAVRACPHRSGGHVTTPSSPPPWWCRRCRATLYRSSRPSASIPIVRCSQGRGTPVGCDCRGKQGKGRHRGRRAVSLHRQKAGGECSTQVETKVTALEGLPLVLVPYWEWNALKNDRSNKQQYLSPLFRIPHMPPPGSSSVLRPTSMSGRDLLQLMWKLMWSRKNSFFPAKPPQIYWA